MSHVSCLQITKAEIVVSLHATGERYAEPRIWGILPRCRKVQLLSISPQAKRIIARPLFAGHGEASIYPDDWREVLIAAPIVSDKLFPMTITPEVEQWARQHVLSICDCPAVTTTDVHPNYNPQYNAIC